MARRQAHRLRPRRRRPGRRRPDLARRPRRPRPAADAGDDRARRGHGVRATASDRAVSPPAASSTRALVRSVAEHVVDVRLDAASSPTSLPASSERYQRCSRISWKISAASRLPQSSVGHGRDRRLEHLRQPAVGDDRLGQRPPRLLLELRRGSAARSLSSRRAWFSCASQARQHQQPPAVVAGLDDVRVEPQPVALAVAPRARSPRRRSRAR